MLLYEKKNTKANWKLIDSFAVVVGKNGLGKDKNATIAFADSAPLKHEGDDKCPSGIFKLGSVFSYHKIDNLKMPFVQVDTNFYYVDDMASSYYNTLIIADTAKHDFNSFEYMKRNDDFYEMAFGFYTTAILLLLAMAPVFFYTSGATKIRNGWLHGNEQRTYP